MSCVLRVSGASVEALSRLSLKPYRVEEGIAHFDVSKAGFDDFAAQVEDAIVFLRSRAADVKLMLSESGTTGVLDFGIERRDVAVQFDTFPAELVREAGGLGLSLELSQYPVPEARGAEA